MPVPRQTSLLQMERSSRWIDAGIGSGTQERFRVTGEWGHRNIARQGLQGVLASRVAFDGDGRFLLGRGDASLLEPWLAGTRTRGQVTLYYENLYDRANPDWVQQSEARGVTFELRRAGSRMKRLQQTIIVEVRRAARNLEASQEAIESSRDAERAAQEQLRAERIRLEYGESTPFDVLQREEDLVDRENELIDAFRAYRNSVTSLDRAQGTILRNRNIRIDEVGVLR